MNRKLREHEIRSDPFGEVGSPGRSDVSQMFILVIRWKNIPGRVSDLKWFWPHEAGTRTHHITE